MKLKHLSLKNFMPYKGEQQIVFPTDEMRNVMVIFGDNMRGKTSILNAIRWCFYGVALGRHLRAIPRHLLLNSEAATAGEWDMEVAIQFEATNRKYDLRRKITKRKLVATPTKPEDFEEEVRLQRDGVAIAGHAIEAEINSFAPEQVSRFFLFDGELLQEYETLLIEGSDQGKRIKEAIEQVLGVPALINGRDEAGTLLKRAQKLQNHDLNHVKGAERHVESQRLNQAKQETYEADLLALKDRLKKVKDERGSLDDELEKSDAIHRIKVTLDNKQDRRNKILKDQERIRDERLLLLSGAWKDLLKTKLTKKLSSLRYDQERLTNQIGMRSALEAEISQIEKILALSSCPTCGQEVAESRRSQIGLRLDKLQTDLEAISINQDLLNSISAEISTLNRLIVQSVSERVRDRDRDINRLDVELTSIENDIEAHKEEIRGFDTAEIARKRSLHAELLKQEGAIEVDLINAQKQLEKIKQELAVIAKQLQDIPQARAVRSSALVEIYSGLERVFGASIETLRESLRRHVEAKATEAFLEMTTQAAYKGLRVNDNYGLTIIDDNGEPVSIRSAGAEQIVALSLIDGLSRTGRAAGPVVMDTPFGRLDTKHRDNILRYLPQASSQLILLVHDGEIRKEVDLLSVANRLGGEYVIKEINPRHSIIERSQ